MVNAVLVSLAGALVPSIVPRANIKAACPTQPACPSSNGCLYKDKYGDTFQITCSVDLYDNDLQTGVADSFAECLEGCGQTDRCVAVSYVGKFCYMKSGIGSQVFKAGDQAAMATGSAKAKPTSTAYVACGNPVSCPASDGCTLTTGGKPLVVRCSLDFYGGDLSSSIAGNFDTCVRNCSTNAACKALSFAPSVGTDGYGTCYLKNTVNQAVYDAHINGAYLVETGSTTLITTTALTSTTTRKDPTRGPSMIGASP